MGKAISDQGETKSQQGKWGESPLVKFAQWMEAKELIDRARVHFFFGPQVAPSNPEPDEPKPFPNWQPVKCSDECCGWRGPAAKSVSWGEDDPKRYCPKCWNRVVKHESNGGSPP